MSTKTRRLQKNTFAICNKTSSHINRLILSCSTELTSREIYLRRKWQISGRPQRTCTSLVSTFCKYDQADNLKIISNACFWSKKAGRTARPTRNLHSKHSLLALLWNVRPNYLRLLLCMPHLESQIYSSNQHWAYSKTHIVNGEFTHPNIIDILKTSSKITEGLQKRSKKAENCGNKRNFWSNWWPTL